MERYFIRNCLGEVVGNVKGYATYKGAERQCNMTSSKVFANIWNVFNDESDKMDKQGLPASGRLIYNIKLEKVA